MFIFTKKINMFVKDNDIVALVSPAGSLKDNNPVNNAQKLLQKWHLKSFVSTNALSVSGHFAGSDQQRLQDFQDVLNNPDIKMIWALRGGYGSIRIVDELDWNVFKKHPKLIVGFSDITVFHAKLQQMGFESLHAFMPIQLQNKIAKEVIKQTKNAIKGKAISYDFDKDQYTKEFGAVSGEVVGGNLATIYSILGTNLSIDTTNKILFIEDVSEQLYQIDRMMIALKKAEMLKNLKALLVGQFTDIPENNPHFGKPYQDIILEHTQEYNYPVIFDAPIGHITDNYPLMLGRELVLKDSGSQIQLFQPADKSVQNEK